MEALLELLAMHESGAELELEVLIS